MAMYDSRQLNNMRQDAIRRSQEMHRRSTGVGHYSQGSRKSPDIPPVEHIRCDKKADETLIIEKSIKNPNDLKEKLSALLSGKIDSDKLIIIALMIILAREGADIKLILALGYILL